MALDNLDVRDRLIVALDTPTVDEARSLVDRLGDHVSFYKVGLELVMQGGLDFTSELIAAGNKVFLDMKLLDIENTVERAVANVARSGVSFLTIHGTDRKTLRAATRGAAGTDLKILSVTVLTNLDETDLADQCITAMSPADLVVHRARLAKQAGCHGVIASGNEAAAVRAAVGPEFLIVTPGIRFPSDTAGDQARVATPQSAIRDGADHLVVGRPITAADDVAAAADAFIEAITAA